MRKTHAVFYFLNFHLHYVLQLHPFTFKPHVVMAE
jgi:hypothetical protein